MTERESTSHVNAMRDEIERLRAKITRLEAELIQMGELHDQDTADFNEQEAEVATLREAAEAVDQEWIARGDGGCSTKLRLALHTALATPTATAREGGAE